MTAERINTISRNITLKQLHCAEEALRWLMAAYERRVRSECTTPEEIAKQPWRCAEYVAAERVLQAADGEP